MSNDEKKPEELYSEDFNDEPYAFMKETVKKRPKRGRRFLLSVLAVLVGSGVFGVTSGLIFKHITEPQEIIITPDELSEEENAESSDSKPDKGDESQPDIVVTPTPTPAPKEDDEKEMTAEEKQEALIQNQKDLYRALKKVATGVEPSLVTVQTISSIEDWFSGVNENASTGSGLIIAKTEQDLVILTTNGALEAEGRLVVTLSDGTIADAQEVKTDNGTGLSVIRVSAEALPADVFEDALAADLGNSYGVTKGQPVIAVGRPNGQSDSISFGAITSTNGTLNVPDAMYQVFTTDIYGGQTSAGYLINMDGQIVACLRPNSGETQMTALSLSPVKALIERLSNNREVTYIGLHGDDVTRSLSDSTGMPIGVFVTSVEPDSPAFAAGIQPGDIITGMNGDAVTAMSVYNQLLMAKQPQNNISLTLMRNGAEGYVELTFTMTAGGI